MQEEHSKFQFLWLVYAAVVLALLALLFGLYRLWQGPMMPAYTLQTQPLVQTVVSTGWLTSVSRARVGSEIIGVVLERRVQEGDVVGVGDVLIVLRSDELTAALRSAQAALTQLQQSTRPQADLAMQQAQAHYQQLASETTRRRQLLAQGFVSQEVVDQAEDAESLAAVTAERARLTADALAPGNTEETLLNEKLAAATAMLAKTTIRAEVAGTVLTRQVEPGDLVQPGRVLLEIARTGITEILLPLDEKNLSVLELGQLAQGVADAFPGQPFPAQISSIAPSVDAQRGTIEVRLLVPELPANLREGMTVSVNVQTGARDQALVIPNDAFVIAADGQASALRVHDGKVNRVPITIGLRGLAITEVVSGLVSGDQVLATNNQMELADGSRVRTNTLVLPVTASGVMPDSDSASTREVPVSFN
jgi:HlyD family secretion protein